MTHALNFDYHKICQHLMECFDHSKFAETAICVWCQDDNVHACYIDIYMYMHA